MPAAVMLAEKIESEVSPRVPPDGMDVVRVVLRVVMLHEQPRPVQPEVVRVSRLDRAGPGEMDRLETRFADARSLRLGQFRSQVTDELLDQALRQSAVRCGHFSDGKTGRGAERFRATRPGHDVAERPRGDDGPVPVWRSQAADQLAGEILLRAEDAEALERAGRHAGRVRAQEGGCDGRGGAGEREVERKMVPFDAEAPGRSGPALRVAEHAPRVVVRVAVEAPHPLDRAEDVLEAHDVGGLPVSDIAQRRAQERVGGGALAIVHRPERQSLPLARDVVPVEAFGAFDREDSEAPLLGRQGSEKAGGRAAHAHVDATRAPGTPTSTTSLRPGTPRAAAASASARTTAAAPCAAPSA